jgi:hypothetical protein
MQAGLSDSQFFDQHLDPIDRELIRDRRRDPFAVLNLFVEFDALVAHGAISPLKGTTQEIEICSAPIGIARSRPASRPDTGFQRPSFNELHSNRALASPAFGGCSFLLDGRFAGWPRRTPLSRAENPPIAFVCELKKQVRIGLVQSAISDRAGAAHGISNPNATRIILRVMARPRPTSADASRLEASVQDLWTSLDLDTQQGTRVRDCR